MPHDPLLTQIGVTKALNMIAEIKGGVPADDKDGKLTWCLNHGFLRMSASERDTVVLTQRGAAVVHGFWQSYLKGRALAKEPIVIPGTLS